MDKALFIDLLNKTFYYDLSFYILIALCVVGFIIKGIRRPSDPKSKKGKESMFAMAIIGLICLSLIAPKKIIAYVNDISKEQFVCVHGTYTFSNNQASKKGLSRGTVYIAFDKTELSLYLPAGWSEQNFPEGIFTGTIWYCKDSKIILKFLPDN